MLDYGIFVITAISLPVFGQDTKYSSNQMEQIMGEELKHIPRGEPCSPQNFLREVYHMMRMHDLSRANNGEAPKGKLEILKESIESVKRTYHDPDFVPEWTRFFL
jgi:hypothetical protein